MLIITYTEKNKTGKVATEVATKGYYSTKNKYYFGLELHAITFRRKETIPFTEMIILSSAKERLHYYSKGESGQRTILNSYFKGQIYIWASRTYTSLILTTFSLLI